MNGREQAAASGGGALLQDPLELLHHCLALCQLPQPPDPPPPSTRPPHWNPPHLQDPSEVVALLSQLPNLLTPPSPPPPHWNPPHLQDPLEVVNRYGADALRLYLINSPVVSEAPCAHLPGPYPRRQPRGWLACLVLGLCVTLAPCDPGIL